MTIEEFNRRYPVGTEVMYWPPGAKDFMRTWTVSAGFALHGKLLVRVDGLRHPVQVRHISKFNQTNEHKNTQSPEGLNQEMGKDCRWKEGGFRPC